MIRTFIHSFDPPGDSPITDPAVDLDVSEIEDAGIREVLQTPGAAYGAWSILDALLTGAGPGSPFTFKEPLGQAREVKVALSGLFGRFVARAYLERCFRMSVFAHLTQHTLTLDGRRRPWARCASIALRAAPARRAAARHQMDHYRRSLVLGKRFQKPRTRMCWPGSTSGPSSWVWNET